MRARASSGRRELRGILVKALQILGSGEVTSHQQMRHRRFLAALALTVGVASDALSPIRSAARAEELLWATQAGGADHDQGNSVATTERGDSYVTGFFQGPMITLSQGEPNEITLTAGDAVICSLPSTTATAHFSGSHKSVATTWGPGRLGTLPPPRHRGHRARRQLRGRVVLRHGDLRPGRAQRDHPHRGGA